MSTTTSLAPSKKRKVVHVILLSGEECLIYVDVKSKFQEVFNQVAAKLSLREIEYFGLAFRKENEYQFVALDEKIHKQAPKKWKTCQGEGYDSQNQPILSVCFRVQFYVDQVVLLREKVTRHLYYLQLKENVLKYNNINCEEKCFQMVGNALHADYGTYSTEKHGDDYFNPKQYFPQWIIEKRGCEYINQNAPKIHQDNKNLTRSDAELKYIKEASITPSAHNLHFYRVHKKKTDKIWNTWLAVCPKGIEVYEEVSTGFKNLISTFLWPDIGRLYFDKKKFEIRAVGCPDGRKFIYYTESDITSKYLLTICRATHMFQLDIQPKLMEIRHLDAEDKRRYRESYIYSDARDLVANGNWIQHRPVKLSPSKSGSSGGNQRFSVVSDVSSNTTSGIVSDKMTISFDESDDHGKEIIIDTPPGSGSSTTPSTPRSKFAHIISSFHKSKSFSSQSPASSPRSLELYKPRSPGVTPTQLSPVTSPANYRAAPVYTSLNPAFVLHSPPLIKSEREKPSRPVSRNVSRKESLKNQLAAQQLEGRSDQSPASPTTESKAISLGITVLPNKPAVPPFSTAAPTSFTQPFLPMKTPKTTETTPSPSSSSGIGLTPGSESSLPLYPISFSSSASSGLATGGVEPSQPVYQNTSFTASSSCYTFNEQSQPGYNLAYSGITPTDPNINIASLPSSLQSTDPSYQLQYSQNYGATNTSLIQAEQKPLLYNLGFGKPAAQGVQETSPPPYHLSFPSTTSSLLSSESTGAVYMGYTLGHNDIPNVTPTYMNLPDPPPYHAAMSQLASEKMATAGRRSSRDGFDLLTMNQSPPKFNPGITPLKDLSLFKSGTTSELTQLDSKEVYPLRSTFTDSGVVTELPITNAKPIDGIKLEEIKSEVKIEPKEQLYIKKKSNISQKKNHTSKLHPELQVIRGHAQSFPLLTALCNDMSLMQTSMSSAGSYDTSTMKSNNSRISGSSNDVDSRRWSACCPSDSGTMITVPSVRPKSWHSEHFDLDFAQMQASQGFSLMNSFENHKSVPHNLYESSSPHPPTWTNTVASTGELRGSMDKYPPELLAQQHMIPVRLNSGGLNKTDDVNVKTLKETFGMA